jgi:hypothetical protein
MRANPEPFAKPNWQTDFVRRGERRFYFARSAIELYPLSPHLAEDPNKVYQLANGWYADLNLNDDQKLTILMQLAVLARLQQEVDWDWETLAPKRAPIDLNKLFD